MISTNPIEAPMKPVARLHIIKQREYRKRCRQIPGGGGRGGPNYQPNPSWNSGQGKIICK